MDKLNLDKPERAEPVEIAGRVIQPGGRAQFNLPGVNLYTNTPIDMPIEVIHGRYAGPTLLICAAIHGDELNGVEIIRRLRRFRSLGRLRGTLVLVPVVNMFGFIHQSRYLPDRRDLNRCFPGSERGSLASRIANLFFKGVVTRATHIIDLHTAAINRDNLPQIRAALDEPGVTEMAMGFSIPVIINSGLIENSLRYEAGKLGIPVITYEAGEALRLNEREIVTGVRGIVSVMRTLGMLASKRIQTVPAEPFIARSTSWYRAPTDGMFRPLIKMGAHVAAGDALGIVSAPFGDDEMVVPVKDDGIVVGMNNLPLVNEGDALFHVAQFKEAVAVQSEIAAHKSNIEEDRLFGREPFVSDAPG
ncbi:MAG: succinylglutamate desuccinylase/aspartoacylase family protein [Gammaproteobacteria bacterium]